MQAFIQRIWPNLNHVPTLSIQFSETKHSTANVDPIYAPKVEEIRKIMIKSEIKFVDAK